MKLQASIDRINVKLDAMNNVVQTLTLEVHGDLKELGEMMRKPLMVDIKPAQLEIGEK